jgi:hypothetical protein
MKGVKPRNENKTKERIQFMRELFREDCRDRARLGYVDPPLSAPKAQEEFRKKFKVGMNSQGLYKIRAEVFAEAGLDGRGRPKVPPRSAPAGAPLAVAVIKVEDEGQGNFLKGALDELRAKGLIDDDLAVDAVHKHYATVSKFKE